jgi:predicted DNA-binding protein with PD1-like motif
MTSKLIQDGQEKTFALVFDADGTAHGGHLLDASVRPTLEVVVVEASQHLRRKMRGDFGLALLDLSS